MSQIPGQPPVPGQPAGKAAAPTQVMGWIDQEIEDFDPMGNPRKRTVQTLGLVPADRDAKLAAEKQKVKADAAAAAEKAETEKAAAAAKK